MKRKFTFILILAIILLNASVYADIGIEDDLRSYILADTKTGEILESHNIDEVVEIASISKIMTYTVVMDNVTNGNISLDDIVTIDADTASINGSTFRLQEGESFTVRELLEASMVVSGNDATYALAKYVAVTEENFAKLMNEKAKELGLENAIFYNSTGLPIYPEDVQNMMTTNELFQLSNYIINNYPDVIEISKLQAISRSDRDFFQWNSNPLIPKIKEVDGLKTGFTNKAGYCHVSTFIQEGKKGETEDLRLIGIVMGAKELVGRNRMSEILVRYGLNNYSEKIFLDPDVSIDKLYFEMGEEQEIDFYPATKYSELVKENQDIELIIDLKDNIRLPLEKDQIIGTTRIIDEGKNVYETNILVKEKLEQADFPTRLTRTIFRTLRSIFN